MNNFIIIIGSRNNGQWVKYNISSILSQDYPHYKVIYYDDASDDIDDDKYEELLNDFELNENINSSQESIDFKQTKITSRCRTLLIRAIQILQFPIDSGILSRSGSKRSNTREV
jgi:glycosyltransferase involved in cell wall biosynthesis